MNVLRFTAEASLYKTSGHYRTGRHSINLSTQIIGAAKDEGDDKGEIIIVSGHAPDPDIDFSGFGHGDGGGSVGGESVPSGKGRGGGGGGGTKTSVTIKTHPAKASEPGTTQNFCNRVHGNYTYEKGFTWACSKGDDLYVCDVVGSYERTVSCRSTKRNFLPTEADSRPQI